MQAHLTRNSLVTAPLGGGYLNLISIHGELLMQVPVPQGSHPGSLFLRYAGPEQRLVEDEDTGVLITDRPSRAKRQTVGEGHFESSANPAFKVTPQDRHIRDQNQRIARLEAIESRLKSREIAMERAATSTANTPPPEPVPPVQPRPDAANEAVTEDLSE